MKDTPETFAGIRTMGEARSERTQDAGDWSARDVLIAVLRMIDEGKIDPDSLVVVWSEGAPAHRIGYRLSTSKDPLYALGMVHALAYAMSHET